MFSKHSLLKTYSTEKMLLNIELFGYLVICMNKRRFQDRKMFEADTDSQDMYT